MSQNNDACVSCDRIAKDERNTSMKYILSSFFYGAVALGTIAQAAPIKPVKLGSAGAYVILSQTGITDVAASKVKGNVGTSPITGAADLLTCSEVTGHVFSIDANGPAPCSTIAPQKLGVAVADMQKAYTNAAHRLATVKELGAGNIGGLTIPPGVYSWSSGLLIPTNVTLQGGPTDIWIFQVAQDVDMAAAQKVILSGGALPQNIYWQVAGSVTIGSTAAFEGVVLSKTSIAMKTGASVHGRLFAQTAVSLEMNAVTKPKLH